MAESYEYHYRHREVKIERNVPIMIPNPPPQPSTTVTHYVTVERTPPPPKKRVVFIEVEKSPPPLPPPKERVVVIRVEKPAPPPPPPRPLYDEILAISRAGLVFDGRLVIDAEFRTNDRWVFAAGTMTKYSRKLRISKLSPHAQYNRIEVGEKLAENLVSTIASDNKKDEGLRLGLPGHTFREPVVVSCLLPGGYRYLYVRKPGVLNTIEDLDKEVDARDDVFTSGSRTADTGYFRLRLNQFRTVECVTCFGKTDFDIQNMISLYGRHEAMLNDLKRRFLNSEIGDFFAYFNEPWAAALFSDDFDEFRRRPRCFCPDGTTDCKQILRNYLTQALTQANYEEISESDRAALMSQCLEKSCYLQEIEDGLIEFLERHEDELPMYKTSRKERRILREIEDTPLVYRDNAECICQSSA